MLRVQRLAACCGICVALLFASAEAADTVRWLGKAPFCTAKPGDCGKVGMVFSRTHPSGDGNTCLTGVKVMCLSQTNVSNTNAPSNVAACPATAKRVKNTLTCRCEASMMNSGSVWGTDTYTYDSKICRAARHAGVVSAAGGVVRLIKKPGQKSYRGSTRHGITTRKYGVWGGSFSFIR